MRWSSLPGCASVIGVWITAQASSNHDRADIRGHRRWHASAVPPAVGIGRIYIGDTKLGVIQLIVGLLTRVVDAVIWGIVHAVLIFTDKVRDPAGRPLRDGT